MHQVQASPWQCCLLMSALLGCAASVAPPGVERFAPDDIPEHVRGPMPGFGPFDSYREALYAACPLILSQRGANAGHRDDMSFRTRWQTSTEYCAWLYSTPDGKYEMSRLVESTRPIAPDDRNERGCTLPAFVEDSRYPPHTLKHLFILHNHPSVPTHISGRDIRAVITAAQIHGDFIETKDGRVPISIVAFFSNHYDPAPTTCDGFFEYSRGSTRVMRWTPDAQGGWQREEAGTVTWKSRTEFEFVPQPQ